MTRPDWARDGADWPNREHSRFVAAGALTWHVQVAGEGPVLLLLHGTGASTHSWADLLPLLAQRHTVVAPDLPGHGFTGARPSGMVSLPWMAGQVGALTQALGLAPAAIVGHSAGAAVAMRMLLGGHASPAALVSLNGALLPFPGTMSLVAPALAKLLFVNPFVPRLMAWQAGDARSVRRMLDGTGSALTDRQVALYARLFRRSGHVDGALAMMANWDLDALAADLPGVATPVTLVAAGRDRFVPPARAEEAARRLAHAQVVNLPALGHLAHEEDAATIAAVIGQALTR